MFDFSIAYHTQNNNNKHGSKIGLYKKKIFNSHNEILIMILFCINVIAANSKDFVKAII